MQNKFSEFYILLGEAYYKITNYKVAEGYLLKALDVNKKSDKLNQDEVSYLNLHIYYWLHLTYKHLYDEVKASQCSKLFKSITYNEENVRRYIKNSLPFDEV